MNQPSSRSRQVKRVRIERVNASAAREEEDLLAAEEPLEIKLGGQSIAVVMRTPGEDRELAAGFLVTEGLVRKAAQIRDIKVLPHCRLANQRGGGKRGTQSAGPRLGTRGAAEMTEEAEEVLDNGNVVNVQLTHPNSVDLKRLTRHVFSSSSCGVCSKATIEAVRQQFPRIQDEFVVSASVLRQLPASIAARQETFQRTGGLQACALIDETGKLVAVREDVGRHNALDKVIGWALLQGKLPLRRQMLLLSGRVSFEMMQKALAAGIPLVAAISAPSSLAVEFARASGQTLVGFLRGERMNVYAGNHRVLSMPGRDSAGDHRK
ncbi:MAG TPA: formate dehydrogenase accessory sulfurtransferase FdhD [Verrucomicrobiae bacterium]|nr:formate dehydrogenase accessory sulfurtransferase FdhD [Verrucomicrobiae bacterium]